MRVLQILGTNGSGKSSLARSLAGASQALDGLTFVPQHALIILGDYRPEIKTPGCDKIRTRDAVIAELERAVALAGEHLYRTVVFEGMMVGTVRTYYHACVKRGWDPWYVLLQAPHAVCLARIQARTGHELKGHGWKVLEHAGHACSVAAFAISREAPTLTLDGTLPPVENVRNVLQFLGERTPDPVG